MAVRGRLYDICEYLALMHERGELRTDFQELDLAVPYHAPCQQRGHGIGTPALDLMALVPGLEATQVDATCCGIAGTYGLKREKYEIAMAVGRALFEQVRDSGAERGGLRLRDLPLADHPRHRACRRSTRSRCSTAPTGSG